MKTTISKTDKHPGNIFCQYAGTNCPESFTPQGEKNVLFLYPSRPAVISSTIESGASVLSKKYTNKCYQAWRDLRTEGKTIFCVICKAIFSSSFLVCDITTLNFNVLFEIGYVVGLSKPFLPIFDTSFGQDRNLLTKIGLLDTIGYREFMNAQNLVDIVEAGVPDMPIQRTSQIDKSRPIYYLKAPLDTEGSLRITSSLKKSWFGFRVFDPKERPRLPLHLAISEVDRSRAVIAHLLSPDRKETALIHNARCAFVAGLAMASQKRVLLIQEGKCDYPIDYRELIRDYDHFSQINVVLNPFFRDMVETLQSPVEGVDTVQRSVLEDIDIGDIAAENEIENLRSYYVRTGQFTTARKGHAQIVVGRKGSGKTALFYALGHHIGPERMSTMVLDLKPEGYQFARLQETILQKFSPAVQQHTLTALWDYVLLLELAHKIMNDKKEMSAATRNPDKGKAWNELRNEYSLHRSIESGDFSERLASLIESVIERSPAPYSDLSSPEVTQWVFQHDIKPLRGLLVNYLRDKDEVWLLFDNLDKNWRISADSTYQVVTLRCLLDASRKLQKMLVKEGVAFHSTVFLRNDIYSFFLDNTADRGKDQVVHLNWDDVNTFKEIFRLRVERAQSSKRNVDEIWSGVFDLHVLGQNSFNYIMDRTLMRPRDFLVFLNHALQTAINRGHNRVTEDDLLHAEEAYSRDLFEGLVYEIRDMEPALENMLYCFLESNRTLSESELTDILREGNVPDDRVNRVIEVLLWFCFLGIRASDLSERYAYSASYDIKKLVKLSDWAHKKDSERVFTIHPGFAKVLETKNKEA